MILAKPSVWSIAMARRCGEGELAHPHLELLLLRLVLGQADAGRSGAV